MNWWTARDPSALLEHAPSRGRALAEAALVLATVFVPANLAPLGHAPLVAVTVLLALGGLVLLRPWTEWRAGQPGRALAQVLLFLVALAASTGSSWTRESPQAPARLGVQHERAPAGGARVTAVTPGRPAEGRLEAGDRIVALDGAPLSAEDPAGDLRTRIREAGGGAETTLRFTLERAGEEREVAVPVGPRAGAPLFQPGAMTWLCLRALGMILLVALLLWRNGQGPAQVGLGREGLGREVLLGLPAIPATYAVHIAGSLVVAAIAVPFKLAGKETLARKEVASALVDMGLSVPVFAAAMVLVTGFEELAFRGFLVPRLRVVLGEWRGAVLVSAALFGLGHVYEGTLAVFQTAALGAWFGAVFVWRARLPSVMVAHAAFNTVNFALMLWLHRSGLLDKLTQLAPK